VGLCYIKKRNALGIKKQDEIRAGRLGEVNRQVEEDGVLDASLTWTPKGKESKKKEGKQFQRSSLQKVQTKKHQKVGKKSVGKNV